MMPLFYEVIQHKNAKREEEKKHNENVPIDTLTARPQDQVVRG